MHFIYCGLKQARNILVLFVTVISYSQEIEQKLKTQIEACSTIECKIANGFKLSEYYLEKDEILNAQNWLDSCKLWNTHPINPITQTATYSLQAELFYYLGLFQFGISEAQKGIDFAMHEKDSASIADLYFFKGINLFEMNEFKTSEWALKKAERYYPSKIQQTHLRTLIKPEHIFNNIAQLKLQIQQWDSSYYYNRKAYKIALKEKSGRAIANCELTFGLIKLRASDQDSVVYYFNKSKKTALHYQYYDIALLNEGFLMTAFLENKDSVMKHHRLAEEIIRSYPVNTLFKRLYYKEVVNVFEKLSLPSQTIEIQKRLLAIEDSIRFQGNILIQNVSKLYLENEEKLFHLKQNEFEKQKKINLLQLLTLLLIIFSLVFVVLLYRRKTLEQKRLLQQKTEISNDLHDDIGSNLTSILIHSKMLETNPLINQEHKSTLAKISSSGSEISQRLNTFIWTLNEANDNLQVFLEYIKQYAFNAFESTPIVFKYDENLKYEKEILLSGNLRKNTFYCIKELITNVLKHSDATLVAMDVLLTKKRILQITLFDNGSNLKNPNPFGNGLLNIEKRMSAHKGKFFYENAQGFKATLVVPL